MVSQAGIDVVVSISIEDGPDLTRGLDFFKWRAFINGGYSIYARFIDPNLSIYQELINSVYLKEARKRPLKIKFRIYQELGGETDQNSTRETIAYATNMESGITEGGQSGGFFEIIAIDPLTWFLNRGTASGRAYTGTVSNVIKQVIGDFAPGIAVDISNTNDNATNTWYMMRQDPKTFIITLLDWSCSLTNQQTNWIISPIDEKVVIREQAELQSYDLGEFSVNSNYPGGLGVTKWHRVDNNYLTNIQTRIATAGISSVSGLYCDSVNSITADRVIAADENTQNKLNVELVSNPESPQGFLKPTNDQVGWSFVRSVPEDSGGLVGPKYQDYISGRARNLYLGSLGTLNRLVVKVPGSVKFDNPTQLGASTIYLIWQDSEGGAWSANAKWLVYGWDHEFTEDKEWYTYVYCRRYDADAAAKIV